MLDKELF